MAATLALVVSGAAGLDYLDECLDEGKTVPTPLGPSEAMWLEEVQLLPKAETAWKAKEQAKRADVRNEARELREHVLRQVHIAALRIDRLAVTDLS